LSVLDLRRSKKYLIFSLDPLAFSVGVAILLSQRLSVACCDEQGKRVAVSFRRAAT
jgi:hypothetical protein